MPERPKRKIAVVDDEKAILEVFQGLGRRFGFEMEFFSDPAKAVDAVALDPAAYALVITDMRMPGLDGLTFAHTLRGMHPRLRFIFMTGFATAELREEVAMMPGAVFLEKPFQLERLFKETIPGLLAK